MRSISRTTELPAALEGRSAARARRLSAEVLALALLLALAAAPLLLRRDPPPYEADLTRDTIDSRVDVYGVHLVERNAQFAYRWSTGYAFARLPHAFYAAPAYLASARLRPAEGRADVPLTLLANERPLATLTPDPRFRTYRALLPSPGEADLRFAIETEPFSVPPDTRRLGLLVTGVSLQPLPADPLPPALVAAGLLLALWGWLRLHGAWRGALAVCAVSGAALAGLYAVYQPAPLRYEWLAALAVLGSAGGALVARSWQARAALAALAALVAFSGALWPAWLSDDAYISFRYAQNLVAGHGLVFNPGERVEGYTNFLWTMLAALVIWLGGDPGLWSFVSGVALALALLLATYRLADRLLGPAWALAAALVVASSQSLLVYTARGAGMETGLFALLALLGSDLYLAADGRPAAGRRLAAAGALLGLAALTRPEGALLLALTALHALVSAEPRLAPALRQRLAAVWPLVAAFLLVFAPYFAWRLWYYGDPLPNTFYAKTGGGPEQWLRGLVYAGEFALVFGGPLLLVAAAPLIAWRRDPRPPLERLAGWRGLLGLLVAAYTAYIVVVGGDHFPGERFFVPLVPWLALLIAAGLRDAWGLAGSPRARLLAQTALAATLVAYPLWSLARGPTLDWRIQGNDESLYLWRDLGLWLGERDDASIAAMGIGAIAYFSGRETIDMLGLTDRHIARVEVAGMGSGAAGHEKRDPAYVLDVRRPTYIPRMWDEYFGGERALAGRYRLIEIRTPHGYALELWERVEPGAGSAPGD